MNIFWFLIIFSVSAVVLTRSATFLVKSLTTIGRYHKIGEFAISFIFMAFATSLPELIVSIMSVGTHSSELALGTLIGSNIAALTLIIGLATVYAKKIRIKSIIKKKDILYMTGICIVLVFLMMDGDLTRWDSGILFMIYGYYIYRLTTQEKQFESKVFEITKKDYISAVGYFITSITLLIASARILAWTVENIGAMLSIPITLIGIVIVALGTSLPELSFELTAVKEKHQDMVLGDIIGSVVTNSTLIIGIVGLLNPINNLDLKLINIGLFFLIFVALVIMYFVKNDGKLTTREGLAMIISYIVFVSLEYLVKMVEM